MYFSNTKVFLSWLYQVPKGWFIVDKDVDMTIHSSGTYWWDIPAGVDTKNQILPPEMGTSEMLVNLNYSSLEEFYPTCAIAMLMKVIKDPTLGQHHNEVVRVSLWITWL